MKEYLQSASKVRAPRGRRELAVTNKNGLIEMAVYLIEFQLDDEDPGAGFWQMKAIQAGGYWFAASDRDYADGPLTVRTADYTVIRHLKASRLTLADFHAETPRGGLFGRMVGGRGGAYCGRPKQFEGTAIA